METQTSNDQSNKQQETGAQDASNKDEINEFVRLGRTGRRNAIADFQLDPNINLSTLNITELMLKVDCKSSETNEPKGNKADLNETAH